ncbi:Transposase DDE domain protein [Tepidimonas taiwanensis]|uniref:Transposase DDE domain protein n=1 Tax=Tepidimonas taiwanensis TaxID=307486 RepID=A0A554X0C7_9BURK|nr:Transposase DDE domain protein [Tepidimonas taiwanensis]
MVDSTVQHKAIAHPTDSRLLEVARAKLVAAAKQAGLQLKQTLAKEGKGLLRKAHEGRAKLYAWYAPEVDCISKGKARTPYEFGVKVGIVSTLRHNLIVGARAFHGNPYDGHTLASQLEQASILMQDLGITPHTVFVDLGYRGVDGDNPNVRLIHRGKLKRISARERAQLKRRQAIEPVIGHLKADCRMDRCHLKGKRGDRLHAVLCAAGYNIRWLLRMIAKKGLRALYSFLLHLLGLLALGPKPLTPRSSNSQLAVG